MLSPVSNRHKRPVLRGLDSREQIVDRLLSHPLEFQQVVAAVFEPIDVGETADEPLVDQLLDELDSQPFDVQRGPRGEKPHPLAKLCGALRIRTPNVDSPFVLYDRRVAFRALVGNTNCCSLPVAAMLFDTDDMRNDLSRLLHDDPVADAHAQTLDFIPVVQTGPRNGRAGDFDRFSRCATESAFRSFRHERRSVSIRLTPSYFSNLYATTQRGNF